MSEPRPAPKILHLAKYYPPAVGGIEAHVQTLARAQAALGAEVTVLCVNHAMPSGEDVTWSWSARTRTTTEVDRGVRLVRLGRLGVLAKVDLTPRVRGALARLASVADHVHLHAPNPLMMSALALVPCRANVVVTWHSDVVKQRIRGLALRPLEDRTLERAGLVLASSAAYIAGSPALRRHRSKVEVLSLGLDLGPFTRPSPAALAERDELLRRHGDPLWLSVGRLVYYKGLDAAILALRELPGKLIVVGTGPEQRALAAQAREAGVADRVVWLGHSSEDQLVGAYLAATALLFPSNARSEGFGLVQIEAMASGCPVINTAISDSGAPFVSLDGVTGFTVPVNAPAALAAAALRLLDPGIRARLSEAARARAWEFDHVRMARRSLELYASASASRRPGLVGSASSAGTP